MRSYKTKNFDFIPHSRPTLGKEEIEAVAAVIASGNIAEGEVVHRFENAFAKRIGVSQAVAVSSGTAALHLTLLAMDIGAGDEVIFPSYVCTALLQAVRYVGASPIIAEIDPATNRGLSGVRSLNSSTATRSVRQMFSGAPGSS